MPIKRVTMATAILQNTVTGGALLIRFKQIPKDLTDIQRDEFWKAFKDDANQFNDENVNVTFGCHGFDVDLDQLSDPV